MNSVFTKIVIVTVALAIVAGFTWVEWSYIAPRTIRATVTNTIVVKRDGVDQYRINYVPVIDGKPDPMRANVLRNEDNFFFLKWNSGTIDSKIAAMPKGVIVDLRVYGWRSEYFSMFPNIISFEIVN